MTKIREKSHIILWLLLFFFIASMAVGGLVGGANILDRLLGKNQANYFVGKVDGVEITRQEFSKEQRAQLENQKQSGTKIDSKAINQSQNSAWNTIVDRIVQKKLIDELELHTYADEVYDFMLFSPPVSLQKQLTDAQLYADTSGNFILSDYQTALRTGDYPPQLDQFWMVWESYLKDWLPNRKLQNIYNHTASISDYEVKRDYIKKNINCDVEYIFSKFNDIPDSLLEVTDAEILEKYNEDKEENYKLPKSRTVEYVFWSNDLSGVDSLMHVSYIDSINGEALRFASEADFSTFTAAIDTFNLTIEDTLDITEGFESNSGIPYNMGVLRNAVRFAYDNPIGSLSDPIQADNGIAVFHLLGKKEAGFKDLEEVRDNIKRNLMKEKKKEFSANLLSEAFNETSSYEAVAEQSEYIEFGVDTSKAVGSSFRSFGRSSELTGTLMAMSPGETAGPFETYSSIVYLRLIEKDEFNEEEYMEKQDELREQLLKSRQNQVYSSWLPEKKETIEIIDFRSKIY